MVHAAAKRPLALQHIAAVNLARDAGPVLVGDARLSRTGPVGAEELVLKSAVELAHPLSRGLRDPHDPSRSAAAAPYLGDDTVLL